MQSADNLLKKACNYVKKCEFAKAIDIFLKIQAWEEAGGLLELYGKGFYETGQVGMVYSWLETIDEAELKDRPQLLMLYGRILNDDYLQCQKAIDIFTQAGLVYQKQEKPLDEIKARIWKSVCYRTMGQGDRALKIIRTAMSDMESVEIAGEADWAWANRNRAIIYIIIGRVEEALESLQQCLTKFKGLRDEYYTAMCHHDIGLCLMRQAKIGEAEHHYETAVRMWKRLNNSNNLANSLNSLGSLLYLTTHYDEALSKFEACLKIANDLDLPLIKILALAGMADVSQAQQKYQKACKYYRQSRELAKLTKVQDLQIYNMLGIGETLLKVSHELYEAGQDFEAQKELDKALGLSKQAGEIAINNGLDTEFGRALVLRSRIYMYQGRTFGGLLKEAINNLGGDTFEQSKAILWMAYGRLFYDGRPLVAFKWLESILPTLMQGDTAVILAEPITETSALFTSYLHRAGPPSHIVTQINMILDRAFSAWRSGTTPRIQIYALGDSQVLVPGQHICKSLKFEHRGIIGHALEILLYMALEGGLKREGFTSEEICRVLWPAGELEKARSHFNQNLKKLRSGLNKTVKHIEKSGFTYRLKLFWCDVLTFESLFAQIESLPPGQARPLVQEILELYKGDFLAGLELSQWGKSYRANLREKYEMVNNLAGERSKSDEA